MKILGIDPGTSRIGWSIIESGYNAKALAYGCIESAPNTALENKLIKIYQDINKLLGKYKPEIAGLEEIFFANNAKTAISVGHARGVIILAAAQTGIPVLS